MKSLHLCQLLGLALMLVVLTGCPESPDPVGKEKIEKDSKAQIAERHQRKLDNALDILQPQKLGISTENNTAIQQLNQWLEENDSLEDDSSLFSAQAKEKLAKFLTPEEIKELASMQFTLQDGLHIRDCYMYKTMGTNIAKKTENELERVMTLFYQITRLVELNDPADTNILPMTPQEVLLLGHGSAKDRTAIFAGVLQQLGIDSVLLQPASNSKGDAEKQVAKNKPLLMGVLLEGKVYLFDMQLGLPIPMLGDVETVVPQQPATLADVLKKDDILRQLDVSEKQPYPLKAEDLKSLEIKIVINNRFLSAANFQLQSSMAGIGTPNIYKSLLDDESGKGFISRIMQFSNSRWKQGDISVWKYPEEQYSLINDLSSTQKEQREIQFDFLIAPIKLFIGFEAIDPELPEDPSGKNKILETRRMIKENLMRRIRMAQVLGEPDKAIRGYQQVQLKIRNYSEDILYHVRYVQERKTPIDPKRMEKINITMKANGPARSAAIYWTVVCQIEQKEYGTAIKVMQRNLKDVGGSTPYLLGLAYAESGKLAAASQVFKKVPQGSPYSPISQFVQKRCRILNTKAKAQSSLPPKKELPKTEKKETVPKKEKPKEKPVEKPKETKKKEEKAKSTEN